MTCEICGCPTKTPSGEPASDEYFTATYSNDDQPVGVVEYEFCSLEHLQLFDKPVNREEPA